MELRLFLKSWLNSDFQLKFVKFLLRKFSLLKKMFQQHFIFSCPQFLQWLTCKCIACEWFHSEMLFRHLTIRNSNYNK